MIHSDSIAVLGAALAAAQAEIKDITKSAIAAKGTNNEYDYATLSDISKEIRQVFGKHGLSITQEVTHIGGEIREHTSKYGSKTISKLGGDVVIVGLLMHKSGEWIEYTSTFPSLITFSMNALQAVGASVTYGKKYQITAIAGIAGEEDTDANIPQTNKKTQEQPDAPTKKTPDTMPKKQDDSWIKGYLKNMEDLKGKIGDEHYYEVLKDFNLIHANEVKTKADATKVYKAMEAKAKMLDPYNKKEEKNNA